MTHPFSPTYFRLHICALSFTMSQIEKRKHTMILLKAKKQSVKIFNLVSLSTVHNLISRSSDHCPIEQGKGVGDSRKLKTKLELIKVQLMQIWEGARYRFSMPLLGLHPKKMSAAAGK